MAPESSPRSTLRAAAVAKLVLAVVLGSLVVGHSTGPAAAAASLNVQTVYENTPISVNLSDAIGYEFTNTTGVAETITFTDALPPGVTIDNPAALTDTNGSGSCAVVSSTATPGTGTVSLSVLVPSVIGTAAVCTISVGIVPGTASAADAPLEDTYSGVAAKPTASALTATHAGLVVLSDPTLAVTAPQNGQVFALGALSDAGFSCATSDVLDSVDSFFGTDDRGNQIASGEPIDTVDPGDHTLNIECYSAAGGGYVAQTVDYTVGSYALTRLRTTHTAQVSFRTQVPAGKLVAKVLSGKTVVGTTTETVPAAATVQIKVQPTRAGLRAIGATRRRNVVLSLETSFTPAPIGTGDAEITPTAAIRLTRPNIRVRLAAAILQLR